MSAPVGVAILGAGRIGQVHARALSAVAGARVVAVADARPEAAAALARAHGAEVLGIDEILGAGDVEAVIICTPTDTHAPLIERAARAGKAIFCEKPIDLDPDRARAAVSVAEAAGVPLMIGFNRRFDPHFAALKAEVDSGRIGAIETVIIISRDPAPPPPAYVAASGGIFRDMTIHDFDMARFLLGEEIASVTARASVLVDPAIGAQGDYDTASVILTTAGGRQCLISNARRATYGYDQRIEVHGSAGMVRAMNQRPVDIETATAAGFVRPPLHDFFMTRYEAAYRAEIAEFIAALTEGRPTRPDGTDGLAALRIAEAAERSVREGRSVRLESPADG